MHMNVAYYIHVFDIAADVMLDNLKMGGESAKKDKKSKIFGSRNPISRFN